MSMSRLSHALLVCALLLSRSAFAQTASLTAEVEQSLVKPPNNLYTLARSLALDPAGNLICGTDYDTIEICNGSFNSIAGVFGSSGYVDGPANSAKFFQPTGLVYNAAGDLFIADRSNHCIRMLSNGVVSTFAGLCRTSGFVDGVGNAARFYAPAGMVADSEGNLIVVDDANNSIRKIAPDGTVTTFAGSSTAGTADGTGTAARFSSPWGIAQDSAGNFVVSDVGNHAIRRITPGGVVTTFAGLKGTSGSADGIGTAARFYWPQTLAFDGSGNLLVWDSNNYKIRSIAPNGTVTTVLGSSQGHQSGTGTFARLSTVQGMVWTGSEMVACDLFLGGSNEVLWSFGRSIPDVATIDVATAEINQPRTLGSSPQTAVSWQWSLVTKPTNSTATLNSTAPNPTFTPDLAGAYRFRLRAADASGGVSITYRDFTATCVPPPKPVITSSVAGPTCPSTSMTLDAGPGYARYAWSNGATTQTITVAPTSSTTYTVTVYDATNCSNSASYVAGVKSQPSSVTVTWDSGDNTVCLDNSDSSTAAKYSVYNYATDLQWGYRTTIGGPITPIVGATARTYTLSGADFPAPGSYYLVATYAPGCGFTPATSAERAVNINAPITVALTPSEPIACPNGTVTLTATPGGGNGVSKFDIWWNDNGQTVFLCDEVVSCTFNGVPGHTYYVYVRQNLNCGVQSPDVTVGTAPAANPIPRSRQTCNGYEAYVENPNPTSTYQWSNGMTGTVIIPAASQSLTVTETTAQGCVKTSDSIYVSQSFPPEPTITASGPTTFCEGASVILTASGGPFQSYLWSTGATTQSITVDASGSYSVTTTDTSWLNCEKTSAPMVVTVNNATATITAEGPTTFCEGDGVTLTASEGASYLWSNSATTRSITVNTAGNYTVVVTAANGCSATSAPTSVTVNALPPAAITPSGPTTFCEGGNVTLTAPAGYSYTWSNGATAQSITVDASGNYSVTVTNGNGCSSSSAPTSVTVNPTPSTPTISASGPTTFCEGGSVMLSAPAGYSYAWSNGATSQSITAGASGSYSVTVTNGSGCSSSSVPTTVTVNAIPSTPSITASGPTTFCEGGSVTLTASNGYSYAWSTGATSQSITVDASGTYSVTITNANGCSASASQSVTVNALPTATITASGPTTFCEGGNVTLTAPAGYSYTWSTGATSQSITVNASDTYGVTITNANGCSATASQTVTVDPLPTATITASGPTTFCEGGSVTLTASNGYSYAWSTGATSQSITVDASGAYSVTITNANGCSASASQSVTVNALPTATITPSGPTTFCEGASVTLAAPAGLSYLWSTGAISQSIDVTQSGSYSVTVTNASGCSTTSAATAVTVNANPSATITPSGPTTFCQGGSVLLTASAGASYLWSNGATTPSITVTQTGNYNVTVTNASGCSTSSSATAVTVNPLPVATITPSGPTTFCQGGSVVLTASAGTSYLWSNGATTPSITVTQSGNYNVTVTNASGCSSSSAATAVTVNPLPVATITPSGPTALCQGGSVVLTASAGSSYLWSNGATTPSITVTQAGSYNVTVTNGSGCSTTSASTTVTVKPLPSATVTGGGTICPGGSATVQATLTGTAPWAVTWSDGFVQSGIATSIVTRSVSPSSTRSYTITSISDASCTGTSTGAAPVTVVAPPTAVVSGNVTICKGQPATLSVSLTGTGPWSITWSDGLVQSGISSSPWTRTVSPITTTTYSLTSVTGAYCAGTLSGSATITVNQPPTITVQPTNRSIKKNTATTLSVTATGTGTLTYQWYKGTSGITTTPVGTNSSSYTTPKLLVATSYWVKITNSCGSTNSATATVSIK